MATPEEFLEQTREQGLKELEEFLRIPSISSQPEHANDVRRAAGHLAEQYERVGLENAQVIETGGHPVVYADWLKAPNKPTVLLYGHYDVQPVDPLDLWTSPPFEPIRPAGDELHHHLQQRTGLWRRRQVPLRLLHLVGRA